MNIINTSVKVFSIIMSSCYVIKRLLGKEQSKRLTITNNISISMILTSIYVISKYLVNTMVAVVIIDVLLAIICKLLLKIKFNISALSVSIGLAISFVEWCIAIILSFPFQKFFNVDSVVFISMIELLLTYGLLKINRLKNSLIFLQDQDCTNIIIINISAIIIFVYCLFASRDIEVAKKIFIPFIVLGVIMLIMIQKMLTLYYKQKLLKQTIEDYKSEIDLKDEKIKTLAEEKYNISKVNHEFYNRQRALEMKVSNLINSSNFNMEASEDIAIIEGIKNLTKEYSEKMEDIKFLEILPSSDIEDIDDMFKYMQAECKKNNIEFNVKINGNIHYMINNLIKVNKLVTLIGDHIRDAIIAVNSSDNEYRNILAILGVKDNIYEFCVYDSGIEFEIDTLLKLGTEPITTHSKTGGTGIGFMTTFETMKETKASLIIKELGKPNVSNYTKCVTVRLDGKNNYTIDSYRKDEIRMKNINNRDINIK